MHCFAAVPVLVAQYSLVLFSHKLNFKKRPSHTLDTELSFDIPVLNIYVSTRRHHNPRNRQVNPW